MKVRYLFVLLLSFALLTACGDTAATVAPSSVDEEAAAEASTEQPLMTVYKSETCGCCAEWVTHVEEHGYATQVNDVVNLAEIKGEYELPLSLQSCHTAIVDGYVIEGHVPAEQITRLLRERPADVVGLSVPGMPIGSPGMEVEGLGVQPYDVVAFDEAGNTSIFASYPQE